MKSVCVGTGYVGLVAGTCFAESGNDVICVDIDAEQDRARCSAANVPIYEPGLEELIKRNVAEGRLSFKTDLAERGAPVADLLHRRRHAARATTARPTWPRCMRVAAEIGEAMDGYRVIVDKSTVPVGTAERVRQVMRGAHQAPVRRRLESGVPQGRRGDRGLS